MRTELVTNLKRQATNILQRLHEDKEPVLITEHGKPSAYLVDVSDFEAMQQRMAILEGIAKGQRDIAEGRVKTSDQAKEMFSKWLK